MFEESKDQEPKALAEDLNFILIFKGLARPHPKIYHNEKFNWGDEDSCPK